MTPIPIVRGEHPLSRPGCHPVALRAAGVELLPPVHRLLQPARYGGEPGTFVVAVDHLLDVVVVMVAVVIADVLPVADPVADGGDGAGDWHDSLLVDPNCCHPLRSIEDDAVACPTPSKPVSARDRDAMFMVLVRSAGTGSRRPRKAQFAQGRVLGLRALDWGLAQGAVGPGSVIPG